MPEKKTYLGTARFIHALSAIILLASFFLPWVSWDGNPVKGVDMATGNFFAIADKKFGVSNPFPQLSFVFYAFWLIPVLAAASAILPFLNKRTIPFSFFAGTLALSLLTVFYLFSKILIDLGAGTSVMSMLKPNAFIHALAALLLIITAYGVKNNGWKIAWLFIGPVLAFGSFKIGEKKVLDETYKQTETVKTDFKISAENLISEFLANDTAANKKYIEKVLEVDGQVSAVDILPDSSSTIKFADSTGSYAIFSFEKKNMEEIKNIQPGSRVILKGVCSGSIFSEILGTTSISFKRSTLNKN